MPQASIRREMLSILDYMAIAVTQMRNEATMDILDSSDFDWSDTESSISSSTSLSLSPMVLSPLSPASSIYSPDGSMSLDSGTASSIDTFSMTEAIAAPYAKFLDAIRALRDEVEAARILERPLEPMLRASQLHLLHHFAEFRPNLFRKRLRVDPLIFDDILGQISGHPIFQNQSNNKQLPVAIQLAVFLFRAGHYGNACAPEDVVQWAGVSVGTVVNCTHRVMAALLDQHDEFIFIPHVRSEEMRQA
ncbi:hypothetical protein PISMIDRAFT_14194 [Pisolithus microcarpus 441]|uniref:Uncharacterized protein n=1 Tax=Pisolithus microcarpus 441 TaxID=765257 RepID=A0A0C9Y1U6_9AGAM|nr:hypothetical protein PISMIDRAFT_14194 [Pisolithus microcarpus 441]